MKEGESMRLRQLFGMGCVVTLLGNTVQAAPPTTLQGAIDQIDADARLITGWVGDQFKHAAPFNSTAGNVVPSQIKLLGFEVGAEAVVSTTKMDTDGLHRLGTNLVDTNQIDTFNRLPFPMILGHAKIGLPFGFDAGVRIGGLPNKSATKGDTHYDAANSVFGLDLRKSLLDEGMTRPFGLTLGLNFTRAKGHITASTPYTVNAGNNVTFTGAVGTSRTDWDTKSVGVQLLANKQILFLNPYVGVSANKNFGKVDSSISNTGTITFNGNQSASLTGTGGSSSVTPNDVDLRGLAGIEFSILPLTKLGLGVEVGSQNNLAANLGLRVQFR
jgi:hypothetical protein